MLLTLTNTTTEHLNEHTHTDTSLMRLCIAYIKLLLYFKIEKVGAGAKIKNNEKGKIIQKGVRFKRIQKQVKKWNVK